MEMDKRLDLYLEKVEKYLKPLVISERVDIVQEIKSEMCELSAKGLSAEQILERLGEPKALAKSYLGDVITGTPLLVGAGCWPSLPITVLQVFPAW